MLYIIVSSKTTPTKGRARGSGLSSICGSSEPRDEPIERLSKSVAKTCSKLSGEDVLQPGSVDGCCQGELESICKKSLWACCIPGRLQF